MFVFLSTFFHHDSYESSYEREIDEKEGEKVSRRRARVAR